MLPFHPDLFGIRGTQALLTHGARRGSWLTIRRLGRCRPSRPTADDPVPPPRLSR
ncbi:MAG: membrane protein insertion efficiency factor YidD [Pseudonocardiaceae bacterium]